ncbi:MAG: extracellular solute-binding protein, partial [Thermoproteus sp.]|nr:extracellular solute-binding protein [Thermoproteus sp.]
IFTGEIKYWDDPRIKELNPELAGLLPHKPIVRVVRADPSGTNAVFTLYLNKSSPFWQRHVGRWGLSVDWPNASSGLLKGQGNPGVASTVEGTPYSIGYIEYNYWAVKVDKYNSFGGVALLEG